MYMYYHTWSVGTYTCVLSESLLSIISQVVNILIVCVSIMLVGAYFNSSIVI